MKQPSAPGRLVRLTLPPAIALIAVSLAGMLWGQNAPGGVPFDGFGRLMASLSVNAEAALPAWYSSALLLLCAALCADVARTTGPRLQRRRWTVLAVLFVYLSADEAAQLHEIGTNVVDRAGVKTGLAFSWVLLAVPALLVLGVLMIPFLRSLPRRTVAGMLVAGCVFVGGAVGLELPGSLIYSTAGPDTAAYALVTSVEELCEMVGTIIFAWTVADHQRRRGVPFWTGESSREPLAEAAQLRAGGARPAA